MGCIFMTPQPACDPCALVLAAGSTSPVSKLRLGMGLLGRGSARIPVGHRAAVREATAVG